MGVRGQVDFRDYRRDQSQTHVGSDFYRTLLLGFIILLRLHHIIAGGEADRWQQRYLRVLSGDGEGAEFCTESLI